MREDGKFQGKKIKSLWLRRGSINFLGFYVKPSVRLKDCSNAQVVHLGHISHNMVQDHWEPKILLPSS